MNSNNFLIYRSEVSLANASFKFPLFKTENFAYVTELVALCTAFRDFAAPTTYRYDKMAGEKECVGMFVEHTRAAVHSCVCNVDEVLLDSPYHQQS